MGQTTRVPLHDQERRTLGQTNKCPGAAVNCPGRDQSRKERLMDEMIHAALRPEQLTDDELSAALQEEALTIERT